MTPEEFKRIRIEQFGTQAAAAEAMGVALVTIKSWEHGRRQVPGLAVKFLELRKAHKELLDRAHMAGLWGPWADGWEGSYDQKHWGE